LLGNVAGTVKILLLMSTGVLGGSLIGMYRGTSFKHALDTNAPVS